MKRFLSMFISILMLCMVVSFVSAQAANDNAEVLDARNGVVRIFGVGIGTDENGEATLVCSLGSGFGIGTAGEPTSIFVTNKHVVEDCAEIYILLDDAWYDEWLDGFVDGNLDIAMDHAVKCEVIYMPDTYPDYAILRTERVVTERVALPMMRADNASPADDIYTLGFPISSDTVTSSSGKLQISERQASIESMTITTGTISRFTTFNFLGAFGDAEAIQIDADINKGNSGGPLITKEGYVIGINTWSVTTNDQPVELALKIDYVIERVKNLNEIGVLSGFEPTVIDTDTENEGTAGTLLVVLLIVGGVVVLAGVAVLIIVFITKKRKNEKSAAVASSQVPVAAPADLVQEEFPKTMPVADSISKTMPAYNLQMYRLVCEDGFFAGRRFAIDRPLKLGRDPQKNDLVFGPDTAGVSSVHCMITPVAEGVALTDLGSSYGTFLSDDTKLEANKSVTLKVGDAFYLGSNKQSFKIELKSEQ